MGVKLFLKTRMRLIFWWSIFAVIFMSLAWITAYHKYKSGDAKEEIELVDEEMENDMGDLIKLEIRRRMAQSSGGV